MRRRRDKGLLGPALLRWGESHTALLLDRARFRKTRQRTAGRFLAEWARVVHVARAARRLGRRFELRRARRLLAGWCTYMNEAAAAGSGGEGGAGGSLLVAKAWGAWAMMRFHRL